jgi:amidase
MTTFISMIPSTGTGPRLAVKDLIDVEGIPTTAGSRAVAESAQPAEHDASLLRGFREAGWQIAGKANLHELAFGTSGINPWSGTPVNPLDARLIPGGSSSGSAVAVATEQAELALGSDTGGSIRIPAAFCGVTGLKTTFGRVPLDGVWPLATSLDTVGPMARDVQGCLLGMSLLDASFVVAPSPAQTIGRLRLPTEAIDPVIDQAVDDALSRAGFTVVEISVAEWGDAWRHCTNLLIHEAYEANRMLIEEPSRRELLGQAVRDRLISGAAVSPADVGAARAFQARFTALLAHHLDRAELLALPSAAVFPPPIADAGSTTFNRLTSPINLSGLPALALPVPSTSSLPASLQLVGAAGREDLLLATGSVIESAVAA